MDVADITLYDLAVFNAALFHISVQLARKVPIFLDGKNFLRALCDFKGQRSPSRTNLKNNIGFPYTRDTQNF